MIIAFPVGFTIDSNSIYTIFKINGMLTMIFLPSNSTRLEYSCHPNPPLAYNSFDGSQTPPRLSSYLRKQDSYRTAEGPTGVIKAGEKKKLFNWVDQAEQ